MRKLSNPMKGTLSTPRAFIATASSCCFTKYAFGARNACRTLRAGVRHVFGSVQCARRLPSTCNKINSLITCTVHVRGARHHDSYGREFGDPGQKGHTVTHMIIHGSPSSSAHYHRDIPTINNSTDRQEVVGGSRVNAI